MKRPFVSLVSLVSLLTLLAVPSTASSADKPQATPFTGTTEVTLVEVPVHVVGKDGLPLRGLTKADFELTDDGKRVEVRDLEVIDLEDFSKDLSAPREMPLPPAARRHFLMLFDFSFSTPVNLARARTAAKDFIQNGMKNGDFGAVATLDVEKGLKIVLAFTADHEQLAYAVGTLGLPSLTNPMADPLALTAFSPSSNRSGRDVSGSAGGPGDAEMAEIISAITQGSQRSFEAYQRGRVDRMMVAMSDLAKTLNSVKGRKNILYFSEGVDSKLLVGDSSQAATEGDRVASGEIWRVDNEARFGYSALQGRFQEVFALFNRSDCVLYSVDVAGIRGKGGDARAASASDTTSLDVTGSHGRGQDSLFMMAQQTGGQVLRDSNDLSEQLERVQQQTSLIYLLVFQPTKLKSPGTFHQLKVKVRAPGAHATARAGYYEPRPYATLSPMEQRLATAQLIAYGLPKNDVPARVLAAPFRIGKENRAIVPVIVEVPGERLLADQVGNQLKLELYAYVTDQQLRVRDFLSQQIAFDLSLHRKTLEGGGVKYYGTVFLEPGSYWLKVLVRNIDTGRTGLQIVPVTVPEYDGKDLYILPPLFQETPGRWVMVKGPLRGAVGAAAAYPFVFEGQSFIPSAGPRIARAEKATLCLIAYDPEGKEPLDVEGQVRSHDGQQRGSGNLKLVKTTPTEWPGIKRMLYSFDANDLPNGNYSLVVTVKNPASGSEGQSAMGFSVY